MKLTNKDIIKLKTTELEPTLDSLVQCNNHLVEYAIKANGVLNKQTKIIKRNQKLLGLSLIVTGYLSLCLSNDAKRISRLEKLEREKNDHRPVYYSNKKGE